MASAALGRIDGPSANGRPKHWTCS